MSSVPESVLEIVTVPEIVDNISKTAIDYIETISRPILFNEMLRDEEKRHEKAKCSEIFGFAIRVLTSGECTTFNLDSSKNYYIITSIGNGSVASIIGLKVGDVLIGVYNTDGVIRQIFDFVDEDALYNINGNRLFNDRTILYLCFRVLRYVYRNLLNFELDYVDVLSLDLNVLKHTLRFALPYTNNDVNDTIINFGSVYFEKYIDGLTDYSQQMGGAKGDKTGQGEASTASTATAATAATALPIRPQGPGAGVRREKPSGFLAEIQRLKSDIEAMRALAKSLPPGDPRKQEIQKQLQIIQEQQEQHIQQTQMRKKQQEQKEQSKLLQAQQREMFTALGVDPASQPKISQPKISKTEVKRQLAELQKQVALEQQQQAPQTQTQQTPAVTAVIGPPLVQPVFNVELQGPRQPVLNVGPQGVGQAASAVGAQGAVSQGLAAVGAQGVGQPVLNVNSQGMGQSLGAVTGQGVGQAMSGVGSQGMGQSASAVGAQGMGQAVGAVRVQNLIIRRLSRGELPTGTLIPGNIDVTNPRFLLMNLYLNVIFKTLLSNNILKQKYDESKIQNKPPFIPLGIQEKYMISPPQFYQLEAFPKTKFNDLDVIRKLNDVNLKTKINENVFIGAGANTVTKINLKENTRILNKKNKFLIKLKNIKTKKQKTIKKKIRNIKHKAELKHEINTKIKKYIKNYLQKKEKQLEVLESQISSATNANTNTNRTNKYNFSFNKQENKIKIKKILNSNINNKINKFNNNKYNKSKCANKTNTRKNYN